LHTASHPRFVLYRAVTLTPHPSPYYF
jgi:hypothetical protein